MKTKKNKKIALIIGVTGQDGSLLADFLLKKNYKVVGLKRRSSTFNTQRINHLYNDKIIPYKFEPYYGDLTELLNQPNLMKYIILVLNHTFILVLKLLNILLTQMHLEH